MSLNYPVPYNLTNTLSECMFYVFEIKINNDEKIRRIKHHKEGQIITIFDQIENNISKIEFSIWDINDSKPIIIKERFTKIITNPITLNNNNIILQLFTDDNYVLCKYKFIN